jgi:hypothetical protein
MLNSNEKRLVKEIMKALETKSFENAMLEENVAREAIACAKRELNRGIDRSKGYEGDDDREYYAAQDRAYQKAKRYILRAVEAGL